MRTVQTTHRQGRPFATIGLIVTVLLCLAGSVPATGAAGGAQLWIARYNGPISSFEDWASALSVSPDGSRVYVTGYSYGSGTGQDYATVAYDATTGTEIWIQRYDANRSYDFANALAVSPDGATVYVTGRSVGGMGYYNYATIAYDATTGATLWVSRYRGPTFDGDVATTLAVSPDGAWVYVSGTSRSSASDADYATVAYDATTGTQAWVARYGGQGSGINTSLALAVSPGGAAVYVTGFSPGSGTDDDYATLAYDAATGAQIWVRRYNGPGNGYDSAHAIAVSPDGTGVFVTGRSDGGTTRDDFATVAYDAATGARNWVRGYHGLGNGYEWANAIAVSPDSVKVYVAGFRNRPGSSDDYATLAYDAATGAKIWVGRYNGPGNDSDMARAIAVSPDGARVYVTGQSHGTRTQTDYATVALDATTGAKAWVHRYNARGNGHDWAVAVGVSPDGAAVYVTGTSHGPTDPYSERLYDYATIAYPAG